ncbi:MAG: transposase [Clostridia bacterium]|nr:transposase [Clostridia bacterium]
MTLFLIQMIDYFVQCDDESDCFICENGDNLRFCQEETKMTANGYETHIRIYSNESCAGCPHLGKCHRSKRGFREISVNRQFLEHRRQSLDNIVSDEGILLRVNRSIQVEGAFGVLKQDYAFRRFLFRGKRNIEMQFFLLAFAFNIQKLCNRIQYNRFLSDLFTAPVAV